MAAIKASLCTLVCLAAVNCTQAAQQEGRAGEVLRIGTYDSRAIAVAFSGSPAFKQRMVDLKDRHDKAEAAGDKKLIAKLKAEARAQQKMAHRQAFSTAPVDDILKHIAAQLPKIKKDAGVAAIVSKWNIEALAKHKSAERVDVTMRLVEALEPNERQKKIAIAIQEHEPVPIEEMKDHRH